MVLARTDDDSWDITESVGATALGVAMARAAESDCDCPLFTDRYAQLFVDAAVKRGWDSSPAAKRLPITHGVVCRRAAALLVGGRSRSVVRTDREAQRSGQPDRG